MTVIELLVRSSVVIGVGLLALWCARRQPAAFRHWILALAIILAALQPAIRFAIPGWVIPEFALPREAMTNAVGPDRIDQVTSEIRFEPMTSAAVTGSSVEQFATIVMQVWIAGAVFGLGVLLLGIGWLQWQTARSVDAGIRWRDLCDTIARDLGLATPVRVVQTRGRTLLLTWGVHRHVILLPIGAAHWSDDRKRLVLVHELSHVRRRDWVTQVVAEAARALYWVNPLFWIACARLRIESERACDDVVLGSGIDGASYATHLVDLARSFRNRRWLPAPSIARPSTLERRVVAMLNPELNRGPVPRGRKLVAAALVLLAALPIAAATRSAGAPSGVLRDPSGKVLPGATVRLSAIGTDVVHETQTDQSGAFQFGEIRDGDYLLSARLPGFQTARTRVRVSSAMAPLDFTAQVGTLSETVTVTPGVVDKPFSPRYIPEPPTCGTTELGGNLKPPAKLKHVTPRYKTEWSNAGLTGRVLLQAVIGKDGKIRDVAVVSPVNVDLEEEAINAVSQWEFSPTWLNCEAIDVRMFVTVAFSPAQ